MSRRTISINRRQYVLTPVDSMHEDRVATLHRRTTNIRYLTCDAIIKQYHDGDMMMALDSYEEQCEAILKEIVRAEFLEHGANNYASDEGLIDTVAIMIVDAAAAYHDARRALLEFEHGALPEREVAGLEVREHRRESKPVRQKQAEHGSRNNAREYNEAELKLLYRANLKHPGLLKTKAEREILAEYRETLETMQKLKGKLQTIQRELDHIRYIEGRRLRDEGRARRQNNNTHTGA